jgi:hypothetical protein
LEIFEQYDINQNGELDYKEFVGGIFNNTSIYSKPTEGKKGQVKPDYSEEVQKMNEGKNKQEYLNSEG